ncbi:MAG: CHASE3 domain-containing protein [Chthoniobacterales bacterium]
MLQISPLRNRVLIVGGVLLPLIVLCGLAIWSRESSRELVKSSRWIVHTHRTERELEKVESEVLNAERLERGYLLTQEPGDLREYAAVTRHVPSSLVNLRGMVREETGQEQNFTRLNLAVTRHLQKLDQAISLQSAGHHAEAVATVGSPGNRATGREVLQAVPAMLQQEESLLQSRENHLSAEVIRNEHLALWIAGVYLVLAGGIAWMLWRWAKLRHLIRVSAWSKTVEVDGEYLSFEEYLQKVYRVDNRPGAAMVSQLADELDPRRRF